MVYAFLIQSVAAKDCNSAILYSEVFGASMYLDFPKAEQQKLREKHLKQIAARVNSEFRFKRACNLELVIDSANSDSRQTGMLESGVFRLPVGKPLPTEKHVIWQVSESCGFTIILSPDENKALAENILDIIIKYLRQIFKSFDQYSELMENMDKIASVLHYFLPNGQLIFMNHRLMQQLEKEMFLEMK